MDIYVQSFLNSATKLAVSVTTATTVAQLANLVNGIEGVSTNIMEFYIGTTALTAGSTLGSYGITTGTFIGSSNTISKLPTKEDRQLAKLDLAQLRRQAGGDTTANFYRFRNYYDITELPTRYVGNDVVDNPNPGGLIYGRLWIENPIVVTNRILQETGDYLLQEDGSFILL